jgi:hypothetical protein
MLINSVCATDFCGSLVGWLVLAKYANVYFMISGVFNFFFFFTGLEL